MKKFLSAMVLLLVICGFSYSQQVYAVGYDGPNAVYWLNGQRNVLPKTGGEAKAYAIVVSGSNVYIAGNDGFDAVYWLNGRRTALPTQGIMTSEAMAIAVSGSNVYVAGRDDSDAVYWLNGQLTVLPKTGYYAKATAIAVSGSNVYITGYDGADAVYWLNGRRTALPKTGSFAKALAIAISGSNVYIAGKDGDDPVYWLNGQKRILPLYWCDYGIANGIALFGSDIIIAGEEGDYEYDDIWDTDIPYPYASYWKNGKICFLDSIDESYSFSALAIAVSGSNTYIAGYDHNDAVYWLNEKRTALPKTGNSARAHAITVVSR